METQPQLRQLRNNTTMLFNNQNQPVESVETSVMDSPVTEEEIPITMLSTPLAPSLLKFVPAPFFVLFTA